MGDQTQKPGDERASAPPEAERRKALAPGYRLSLSRLRLRTVRRITVAPGAGTAAAYETSADFVVLADPSHRRPFPTERVAGEERELSLTLGEDERLRGLALNARGIGPRLVNAGAQVLGTVLGSMVGLGGRVPGVTFTGSEARATRTALPRSTSIGTDQQFEQRRVRLEQAIEKAESALVEKAVAPQRPTTGRRVPRRDG